MIFEKTIEQPVRFTGIGLHTGCKTNIVINPAPEHTGIVFRRTDLENFPIKASAKNVAKVSYATSLMKKGVLISTVEHLLSALFGLGIENAFIDIDNLEVPILDGSALPFVDALTEAGVRHFSSPKKILKIKKTLRHEIGDKLIEVVPAESFKLRYTIDFNHPLIGRQEADYIITTKNYKEFLAPARTFGFYRDLKHLKENGLIKGGSLDNAIVLTDDGIMNANGLRSEKEFVHHKMMDFLGDISLLGHWPKGHFRAYKAGHGVHASLVRKILSDPTNYTIEEAKTKTSTTVR